MNQQPELDEITDELERVESSVEFLEKFIPRIMNNLNRRKNLLLRYKSTLEMVEKETMEGQMFIFSIGETLLASPELQMLITSPINALTDNEYGQDRHHEEQE